MKTFRQEFLFIPLMFMFIEVCRRIIITVWPETALFDRGSELETFLFRVWQITWITSASWLLLRVIFPPAYFAMKKFYHNFSSIAETDQRNYSLKFFFCFFFGLVFLMSGRANNEPALRNRLVDTLQTQLNVREATGHNDGVAVETYLHYVGFGKGAPWCAAYVCFNFKSIGLTSPKTAWAPAIANPKYVVWSQALIKTHKVKQLPLPGDAFTIWNYSTNSICHTGFIIRDCGAYFITNEGNTTVAGISEGQGVQSLKRSKAKIYAISNYITPFLNEKDHSHNSYNGAGRFMYQEKHSVAGKANRDGQAKRFLSCRENSERKGYLFQNKGRQFECPGECNYGQGWKHQYAGDRYRERTNKGICFHSQWKAQRKVCLQGTGDQGYAIRAEDTRVCRAQMRKGEDYRKDHYCYKTSPLHPLVGEDTLLGRRHFFTGAINYSNC